MVTGHRRENFGDGFKNICSALSKIAKNRDDVEIVYPVHLNPNVQKPVRELLEDHKNIFNTTFRLFTLYFFNAEIIHYSYRFRRRSGGGAIAWETSIGYEG